MAPISSLPYSVRPQGLCEDHIKQHMKCVTRFTEQVHIKMVANDIMGRSVPLIHLVLQRFLQVGGSKTPGLSQIRVFGTICSNARPPCNIDLECHIHDCAGVRELSDNLSVPRVCGWGEGWLSRHVSERLLSLLVEVTTSFGGL
ncbi:hypothetical protein J6590_075446 [Homalodisca vitripennis]|nr:hypothetical protein J6590_075446 [Homalodisca vitripennis]